MRFIASLFSRVLWFAGFVIIRVRDIERMDCEARGCYAAMKKPGCSERDQGYFNGLADCFSKMAETIRSKRALK